MGRPLPRLVVGSDASEGTVVGEGSSTADFLGRPLPRFVVGCDELAGSNHELAAVGHAMELLLGLLLTLLLGLLLGLE